MDRQDVVRAATAGLEALGGDIREHGVKWNRDLWRTTLAHTDHRLVDAVTRLGDVVGTDRLVRRRHVIEMAGDPIGLFVAANAWGYGPTGYGPARVKRIAERCDDLADRLSGQVDAAQNGPAAAWDALTKTHRVAGFGVAFASKYAYFASFRSAPSGMRPLIADLNTSWAIWEVGQIARSIELRDSYLAYVSHAHAYEGLDADVIEYALFRLGTTIPKPRRTGRGSGAQQTQR